MRVAVKDCIDIAGLPTRGGSRALEDASAAPVNAAVVDALLHADCTIVGKANMHELAYGVTGINAWTGSPVNPLFPDRVPGGSSSGSAVAVAEGIVEFGIGTDTGGSIRTPAACCAVFGFKPTFGRVSREGAWPRRSSLDCIGPFARSMEMIEAAMAIIAPGYEPVPDVDPRYALVRVADVDPEVQAAFDEALAGFAAPAGVHMLESLGEAFEANIAVIAAETHAAFGHLAGRGLLGADVEARLTAAAAVGPERLAWAEEVRERFGREVDALLRDHHVLVLPTMPCFPIALADAGNAAAALRMTALVRPFNLSGHPALTIPVRSGQGLPVGIQIIGRRDHDETVCAMGRMLARELGDKVVRTRKEEELR
ncbi:amidase [Novosphingobium sp. RD2P27]|uniref:Amidase n=1 Tax=Novosphingobium kalidii TaxID=3230299 RepID=A0ABV2D1H8_9SPHN